MTLLGYHTTEMHLTGGTRKIFVSNIIIKTVDESNSARVLVGCKPIKITLTFKIADY